MLGVQPATSFPKTIQSACSILRAPVRVHQAKASQVQAVKILLHSIATTQALTLAIVVSEAFQSSIFQVVSILVNFQVVGVVAQTVPLILIEAVQVRFVTVQDEGVPKLHQFTTGAQAVHTFIARAVATQVQSQVIHHTATAEAVPAFQVILQVIAFVQVISVAQSLVRRFVVSHIVCGVA
jgi:hypothetical protein